MLIFMSIAGAVFGLSMGIFMDTSTGLLFTLLGGVGIFFPLFDNISNRKVGIAASMGLSFLICSWTSFGAVKIVEQVIYWSEKAPKEIASAYREKMAEAEFKGSIAEESGQLRLAALAALRAKSPNGYKSSHPFTYENHATWPNLYDFSSNEDYLIYADAYREAFLKSERMLKSWGCLELGWVEHTKAQVSQNKINVRTLNQRFNTKKWDDSDILIELSGPDVAFADLLKTEKNPKVASCYQAGRQIIEKFGQKDCGGKKCLKSRWCSSEYEQAYFFTAQKNDEIVAACGPS